MVNVSQRYLRGLRGGLGAFRAGLGGLLWPGRCWYCNCYVGSDDGVLCQGCWSELMSCCGEDYCRGCGHIVSVYSVVNGRCPCCDDGWYFDGIVSAGGYRSVLRELILGLKYKDTYKVCDILGGLMAASLESSFFCERIDFFAAVPLYWKRRMFRGYNQAGLLADRLSGYFGDISVSGDLVRVKDTKQQYGLSAAGRRRNVKGAFAVRRGHVFSGSRVCIVDDITASRSTLNECAMTLKSAGAVEVYCCVVATAGENM